MAVNILTSLLVSGILALIGHSIWVNQKIGSMIGKIESIDRKLSDVKKVDYELLEMHKHPDDYDFGTRKTNKALEDLVKELRETVKNINTVIKGR